MPISWGLKASAHYVLRCLASVIVDGLWLVSVMVDGKCKYLIMAALQEDIEASQFIECCTNDFHYILKSIKGLV